MRDKGQPRRFGRRWVAAALEWLGLRSVEVERVPRLPEDARRPVVDEWPRPQRRVAVRPDRPGGARRPAGDPPRRPRRVDGRRARRRAAAPRGRRADARARPRAAPLTTPEPRSGEILGEPPTPGRRGAAMLRPMLSSRPLKLALAALGAALALPAAASASMITYIDAKNVWVAGPDGAIKRQLTTDGTARTRTTCPPPTTTATSPRSRAASRTRRSSSTSPRPASAPTTCCRGRSASARTSGPAPRG